MEKLIQLDAEANAYTCRFDPALLDGIRASYESLLAPYFADPAHRHYLEGGYFYDGEVGPDNDYFIVSYGGYPLLWLSSNNAPTLALFQRFFDGLGISEDLKQLVDHQERIVMYSGFFVLGNQAPYPLWHDDYYAGANAYTLITPLYALAPEHGHLLWQVEPNDKRKYTYDLGEAIVLGEGFVHATEPYKPTGPRVLVSMTFGTDKLAHWGALKQTVTSQAKYFNRPCGHPVGSCDCLVRFMNERRNSS